MDESLDKKKTRTVACNKICRPRREGRLEIRKVKDINEALFSKKRLKNS